MSVLLGSSGASVILGSSGGGVVRRGSTSGKTALAPADLTYLGYFKVPRYPFDGTSTAVLTSEGDGCRTSYASADYQQKCLAMRIVGGERRFFTTCQNNSLAKVVEFKLPSTALSTDLDDTSTAPVGPTVDYWKDSIYGGRRFTQAWPSGSNSIHTHGLFWDETTSRLWFSFGDTFNAGGYDDPCVGFAELTTPTGSTSTFASATSYGPWQIDPDRLSSQNTKGFVTALPASVQAIVGYRLGVSSVMTSILGPHDFGPVLIGFDHPDTTDTPVTGYPINSDRFKPASTDILRYGGGSPGTVDANGNYAYTARVHVPSDYLIVGNEVAIGAPPTPNGTTPFDSALVGGGGTSVNPDGTYGYWHHCDVVSGGVWVETAGKAGFIYTGANGSGKNGYTTSPGAIVPAAPEYGDRTRIWSEYYHAVMIFYSEQNLIDAATGGGYGYSTQDPTIHRVTGLPMAMETRCMGAPVFDSATRRLYAIQPYGYTNGPEWHPVVHCWEVAD